MNQIREQAHLVRDVVVIFWLHSFSWRSRAARSNCSTQPSCWRTGTATAGSHPGAAHNSARSRAFPRSGRSCGRPRRNEPSSTGSGANAKRKKPSTAGSEVTLEEPLVRAHVGEAGGVGVQI